MLTAIQICDSTAFLTVCSPALVWGGGDGWLTLALVIDYDSRELLGWQLSRSGKATTAASALEQALSTRYGTLGRVTFRMKHYARWRGRSSNTKFLVGSRAGTSTIQFARVRPLLVRAQCVAVSVSADLYESPED